MVKYFYSCTLFLYRHHIPVPTHTYIHTHTYIQTYIHTAALHMRLVTKGTTFTWNLWAMATNYLTIMWSNIFIPALCFFTWPCCHGPQVSRRFCICVLMCNEKCYAAAVWASNKYVNFSHQLKCPVIAVFWSNKYVNYSHQLTCHMACHYHILEFFCLATTVFMILPVSRTFTVK